MRGAGLVRFGRRGNKKRGDWAKEGEEKAFGLENREEEDFHFLFLF
jgi:hypothetical protein